MLEIQRRMAVVCIMEIRNANVYYEVFLICEVCEVKCTLKDLPFRAMIVSYMDPQVCRRQGQRSKHCRCCRKAQSGADTEGI
jgi:hypothetical protein